MKQYGFTLIKFNRDEFNIQKWRENIQEYITKYVPRLPNLTRQPTLDEFLESKDSPFYHPENQTTEELFVLWFKETEL